MEKKMVFNEVYSAYYKAISKMLKYAIKKELNKELMYKIIKEVAFEESILNIVPAIEKEEWQLLTKEFKMENTKAAFVIKNKLF